MASLNRVQLIGRLGKDPESRKTPKGTEYTTFSLAVDRKWKDKKEGCEPENTSTKEPRGTLRP